MESAMQQYRLSDNWLESSSGGSIGALGNLVEKLSMNTWVALMVRKTSCTLGCAGVQLAG